MLTFGKIDQCVTREDNRRIAVGLRAKKNLMRLGPLTNGLQIVVFGEFRESFSPVVANCLCLVAIVIHQSGKMWGQIVTTASAELVEESGGPIRFINFQAVAEYGVGATGSKGVK